MFKLTSEKKKTIFWLFVATVIDVLGLLLMRSDSPVAGMLLFAASGPPFLMATKQGLTQGTVYSFWEILAALGAGFAGLLLGETPVRAGFFALSVLLILATMRIAHSVNEELEGLAEDGEYTLANSYKVLSILAALACSVWALLYPTVWSLAAAFATLDVVTVTLLDLGNPKKPVLAVIYSYILFLPAAFFYTRLVVSSGDSLLYLNYITAAMELTWASLLDVVNNWRMNRKIFLLLVLFVLVTIATGFMLEKAFSG